MNVKKLIKDIMGIAKDNFAQMLDAFNPAHGDNGFNERNITNQFAYAFLWKRKESNAFFEVPYYNQKKDKWNLRFDAYVFDDEIGIFIESKRLYAPEKVDQIRRDGERLNKNNIKSILLDPERVSKRPRSIFSLIIADAWRKSDAEWWVSGEDDDERWDRKSFLRGYTCDCLHIKKWAADEVTYDLYWLYALKEIKI